MSLFGTSPTEESPGISATGAPSNSLFDEGHPSNKSNSSLFADDDFSGDGGGSPWDMPTPRKQKTRADVLRTLLPTSDAPDSYIDTFDTVVQEDGSNGRVNASGVAKVFAAARLGADEQASIMAIIAPNGNDVAVGRNEFNVFLALIGLAQEGEAISLDGVDERRRSKFQVPSPVLRLDCLSCCTPPLSRLGRCHVNWLSGSYQLNRQSRWGCTANCHKQPRPS